MRTQCCVLNELAVSPVRRERCAACV